ncbi:MAG: hypothetical protein ACR65X_08450 [Methylocystis sp.]
MGVRRHYCLRRVSGAVGEGAGRLVLDEIDRGDPRLRQRLQRLRAVGVGDDQLELRKIRVAGAELAVMIGVENVAQRLHVGGRRRVPLREIDLVLLVDLTSLLAS